MKATELVRELERRIEEHGDLLVYIDLDWTEAPVKKVKFVPVDPRLVEWKEDRFVLS